MVGLTNEGNSCYFNSALSCFLYTPYVVNNYKLFNKSDNFVNELQQCIIDLFDHRYDTKYIYNTNLLFKEFRSKYKQFSGFYQHDSHEAFMCLIENLPDLLQKVFNGVLQQSVQCQSCNHINVSKESINTLILDTNVNFIESLKDYFAESSIENYKCEHCNNDTSAKIRRVLVECPQVLVIKSNTVCPESVLVIDHLKFELYAIIHYAGNARCGHYTSSVKMYEQWYNVNDAHCVEIPKPNLTHTCVLFYKCIKEK